MAEIILITGGTRSGKSSYAQQLAENRLGIKLFIATCPITDPEMQQRIERHQSDRSGAGWETIEEPLELEELLINNQDHDVLLIDCLTLWINNLLFVEDGDMLDEEAVSMRARKLVDACAGRRGVVIMVTNEVGMGIVPENRLARRYRDLVGRCNQEIASAADIVTLVTCGIPLTVKKNDGGEN